MLIFLFLIAKFLQALATTISILILIKQEISFNKKSILLLSGIQISLYLSVFIRNFDMFPKIIIISLLIYFYYILIKKLYKIPSLLSLTVSLLVFTFSGILEGLVLLYVTNLSNCEYSIIGSINIPRIIIILTISLFHLLVNFFINNLLMKKISNENITNANTNLLFSLSLITLLFWPQLLYLTENQYTTAFTLGFISFIELALITFMSIQKFKIHTVQLETAKDLKSEKIYNQTLKSAVDTIRGFKHDYNNIINTLNGYIILNDMEGLKNYFNKGVLKDTYKLKSLEYLSFDLINDSGIYNLIASKYFECNSKNINVSLDITSDVKSLNIPKFELSRILGILLDNAIEATSELDDSERKITLRLYKNYNSNVSKFVIENTFDNKKNIDEQKVFEKNFSTKKNPSGFGLYEVKKIVDSYENTRIETSIKNNKFKQTLIIQN